MFAPHPTTVLEYWFFKVNCGPVALIVDWIERRQSQEHWLRVSYHTPAQRAVLWEKLDTFMPAANCLNRHHTIGQVGAVAWDLAIEPGPDWIQPDIFPAGLLRMTDLTLGSAPLATFTGWIRCGSQQVMLQHAPGLLSHYWGRQLAAEWWWVSAQQFDQAGVAVECTVLRSSLWGTSLQMPLAYLYLRQNGHQELVLAPWGLAQVQGTPAAFQIEIRRFGKPNVTLTGAGREYGDFGEGIVNTLVGDLEIRVGSRVLARAAGTAGLERRAPLNAQNQ